VPYPGGTVSRRPKGGLEPLGVVHPQTFVSHQSEMAAGCQIMARAVVNTGARLGGHVLINTGCILEHDVVIGAHSLIGSGMELGGGVQLSERTLIGAGVVVRQGNSARCPSGDREAGCARWHGNRMSRVSPAHRVSLWWRLLAWAGALAGLLAAFWHDWTVPLLGMDLRTKPGHVLIEAQEAVKAAMKLGKHFYCEKPLAHTIEETRIMAKVAAEMKVVAQTGNTGHASEGLRLSKEWFDVGAIGAVKEVYVWSDRPGKFWDSQSKPRPVEVDGMQLDQPLELELVLELESEQFVPLFILCVDSITPLHEARLLSEIRLPGWQEGLILNFNSDSMRDGIRRISLTRSQSHFITSSEP